MHANGPNGEESVTARSLAVTTSARAHPLRAEGAGVRRDRRAPGRCRPRGTRRRAPDTDTAGAASPRSAGHRGGIGRRHPEGRQAPRRPARPPEDVAPAPARSAAWSASPWRASGRRGRVATPDGSAPPLPRIDTDFPGNRSVRKRRFAVVVAAPERSPAARRSRSRLRARDRCAPPRRAGARPSDRRPSGFLRSLRLDGGAAEGERDGAVHPRAARSTRHLFGPSVVPTMSARTGSCGPTSGPRAQAVETLALAGVRRRVLLVRSPTSFCRRRRRAAAPSRRLPPPHGRSGRHSRTTRRSPRARGAHHARAARQGAPGAEAERHARRLQPRQARLHPGDRAHEDPRAAVQDAGGRPLAIRGRSAHRQADPGRSRDRSTSSSRSSAMDARSPSRWPIRRTSASSRISSSSRATTSSRSSAGEFTLKQRRRQDLRIGDGQSGRRPDERHRRHGARTATSRSSRSRKRTSPPPRSRRRWRTRRSSS